MTNKFHASGFLALTRVDFGNDARRMQVLHRGEGCLIWAALGRVIEHARSKGLFGVLSLSYVPVGAVVGLSSPASSGSVNPAARLATTLNGPRGRGAW